MIDLQGQKANQSGQWLEQQVENILACKGIVTDSIDKTNVYKGVLFKNVPYINMYGGQSIGEFVLSLPNKNIRIECRQQSVGGSVDEKLPYLFGNSLMFEEDHVILIIEGDGMRKSAKKWLIDKAEAVTCKDIKVMNLKKFRNWTNKNI